MLHTPAHYIVIKITPLTFGFIWETNCGLLGESSEFVWNSHLLSHTPCRVFLALYARLLSGSIRNSCPQCVLYYCEECPGESVADTNIHQQSSSIRWVQLLQAASEIATPQCVSNCERCVCVSISDKTVVFDELGVRMGWIDTAALRGGSLQSKSLQCTARGCLDWLLDWGSALVFLTHSMWGTEHQTGAS